MYLIEKNNLEELEGEINLFGNVDLGTLLTYKRYSNKEVNFEKLKFSDYSSEIYKYIGELDLKKEDYTEEFLLNAKGEDIGYILKYYPGETKDISILFEEAKENFFEVAQVDLDYHGSISIDTIKNLISYNKYLLDEDFLQKSIKFDYNFAYNLLEEITKNDKNLSNNLFNSLSKKEQDNMLNYEKEKIKYYIQNKSFYDKHYPDDIYELDYDEKGEYTYSKIIDTKKIYLD